MLQCGFLCDMTQKPFGIIYSALNTSTGKRYIGQTTEGLLQRRARHWKNPTNEHLRRSLTKYGTDKFLWIILDTAYSAKELNLKEAFWIEHYGSHLPEYGYNKTMGGSSPIPTAETRQKLSTAGKGRKAWSAGRTGVFSAATLKRKSQSMMGKNKGRIYSAEHRKKLSDTHKKTHCKRGHLFTETSVYTYTQANGRTQRHCNECTLIRRKPKGNKWSAESRLRQSEAQRNRYKRIRESNNAK